ncbi:MAG: hypothetical protein JXP34_20220 [Planctomycetes bacterium]|nr:hypothetical protein [Planctomycetota bacterium]
MAETIAVLVGILLARMLLCGAVRLDLAGSWTLIEDPEGSLRPDLVRPRDGARHLAIPSTRPIGEPDGRVWISREFDIADPLPPGHPALAAEAFSGSAEVFINGVLQGPLRSSELPQEVPLGEGLRGGRNRIAFRFAPRAPRELACGPLDRMAIEIRPAPHLGAARIRGEADGSIRFAIALTGPLPCEANAEIEVFGPDSRLVRRWKLRLPAGTERIAEEGTVTAPRAWSLSYASRYELRVRLTGAGLGEDTRTYPFGFRTIEARDGALWLNGAPVWIRGVEERGAWPDTGATAPLLPVIRDTLRRAKDMGVNLVRLRGAPPPARYLEAADEIGLLVWAEVFAARGADPDDLIRRTIERDASRPSIAVLGVRRGLRAPGEDPRHVLDVPGGWLRSGPGDAEIASIPSRVESDDAWGTEPIDPLDGPGVRLAEVTAWGMTPLRTMAADIADGRRGGPEGAGWRFREHRLDLTFGDFSVLAAETQAVQGETLSAEIRRVRADARFGGVLIRSLADGRWRADGLLGTDRREKAFGVCAREILADTIVFGRLPRATAWTGDEVEADVLVARGSDRDLAGGEVVVQVPGESGAIPIDRPLAAGVSPIGKVRFHAPVTTRLSPARLEMLLRTAERYTVGRGSAEILIYPRGRGAAVAVWVDPELPGSEALAEALRARGLAVAGEADLGRVWIRPRIRYADVPALVKGKRVLVLCEDREALPPACGLAIVSRREIHPPALLDPPFLWIRTDQPPCSGVSAGRILGEEASRVRPRWGIVGVEPAHYDDVLAGAFRGWLRSPVAFTVQAKAGFGRIVFTTLRLREAYGDDPFATVGLERLIEHLSGEYCRPRFEPELAPVIQILPTAREARGSAGGGPLWRYTFERPGAGWQAVAFGDARWRKGKGGFGRKGNPTVPLGTTWETEEMWARTTFELHRIPARLVVVVFHDEDVEVFVNGRKVVDRKGYTSDYVRVSVPAGARSFLREGENIIAIHCRQAGRTQTLDVGLRGVF